MICLSISGIVRSAKTLVGKNDLLIKRSRTTAAKLPEGIKKVTRNEFAEYMVSADCRQFKDECNKPGSVIKRAYYDSQDKCLGFSVNWKKYYLTRG